MKARSSELADKRSFSQSGKHPTSIILAFMSFVCTKIILYCLNNIRNDEMFSADQETYHER